MTAAAKAQVVWSGSIRERKCSYLIDYGRLSIKRHNGRLVEDLSERIEAQHAHDAERAARDGHTIAFELHDDGKSAYDLSVIRDQWEHALELIRTGRADGIIAWSEDRLCRQPSDGILLMNAARDARIPVMVGPGSKVYDFTDSTDEFMFLVACGIGKKSSDDTSRRVRDKLARNREEGRLSGRTAFGFMVNPQDPRGPRVVDPEQAAIIREVAARVLDGETWKSIVDDLNGRGVRTPDSGTITGRPFTRTTLRAAMLAPRMTGLIMHEGKIAGRVEGEPILDRETWDQLRSELHGRATGAPRQTRFLLSGVLVCGRCGNTMSSVPTRTGGYEYRVYKCRGDSDNTTEGRRIKCSAGIMAWAAEQAVRDAVLAWQAKPERLAQITEANAVVDAKVTTLRAQLERLKGIARRNKAKLDGDVWTFEEYDEYDAPNDVRIKAIKAELKSLTVADVLNGLAVESLTASYDDATDDERRSMVKVALKSVTVLPSTIKGGGGVDPRSRVICDPR